MRPHRRQPTRLPLPWDSPGKNTGVGCHFLLQCMKVTSESEVAQSCPTLSDPMDCSLPGSSAMGFSRQEYWSGVPLPSAGGGIREDKKRWSVNSSAWSTRSKFIPSHYRGGSFLSVECAYLFLSLCLCAWFFLSLGDLAPSYLISFFTFLFCIGIKPMNSVVTVSGGQQRDLATHVHVSILP